ncbi:MAG: SRPBCC family protein [Acidobacteriota bacterium]|nr:SRPBCC family protein [Acidobacteriota bacterium]
MRFSYQTEQWLPYSLEQIFDFFATPDNLALLMPEWQGARIEEASIVAPPQPMHARLVSQPAAAGLGSRLTLSFLPFPHAPFRLRWEAEIIEFAWDSYFCDSQLRGPFPYWKHCHYFRRQNHLGLEGTVITDDLEYELPFGLAGRLAHGIFLRRQIERTFAYRQSQLEHILPAVTT